MVIHKLAAALTHGPKHAVLLHHELVWRVVLHHLPSIQNQDAVVIGDCSDAMGNAEQRRVYKFVADRLLDLVVGIKVDAARRLVHDDQLGALD
ncbi:hypothetical protein BC936DRAFT_139513 [Jimgerdemannia flammicorona]|uniref:Uncharacterized protein n=1 Tax=Jimgerdemannia flammicorona TaxID=994334 RepID=A0A433B9S3_9FUNG|nr:hypothetical protein BC936DRAFT_139513 [Jimgerdemannia flammicorona]